MSRLLRNNARTIILILIILFSALVRLWRLSSIPAGLNQDELLSGYEAWSLLHTGKDIHGYSFPVYYIAWGSGMNALYSWLTIPFIAIWGYTSFAIRIPQAIMGIVTVITAYCIGEEIAPKKWLSVVMAASFALCPWHILISRFGLESNLLVSFLMLGTLFWIKGLRSPQWFLASSLCYGLSLYCFATIWVILPFALILQLFVAIRCKSISINRWTIFSVFLLFIFALPLMLFLFVNLGWIEEIRSPFLSIPRLLFFRSGEYGYNDLLTNLNNLLTIVLCQQDTEVPSISSNSIGGLFYFISLPFLLSGLVYSAKHASMNIVSRSRCVYSVLYCLFLAGIPSLLSVRISVTHINWFLMLITLFMGIGLYTFCTTLDIRRKLLIFVSYLLSSTLFLNNYFLCPPQFEDGYKDAVLSASAIESKDIYVYDLLWPYILYATAYPTDQVSLDISYDGSPDENDQQKSTVHRIGRYHFYGDDMASVDYDGIYLFRNDNIIVSDSLISAGFSGTAFGNYIVATYNSSATQ